MLHPDYCVKQRRMDFNFFVVEVFFFLNPLILLSSITSHSNEFYNLIIHF